MKLQKIFCWQSKPSRGYKNNFCSLLWPSVGEGTSVCSCKKNRSQKVFLQLYLVYICWGKQKAGAKLFYQHVHDYLLMYTIARRVHIQSIVGLCFYAVLSAGLWNVWNANHVRGWFIYDSIILWCRCLIKHKIIIM